MPYLSDKDVEKEFDKLLREYNRAHKGLILLDQIAKAQSPAIVDPVVSKYFEENKNLKSFIHTIRAKDREAVKELITKEMIYAGNELAESSWAGDVNKTLQSLLHSLDNLSKE